MTSILDRTGKTPDTLTGWGDSTPGASSGGGGGATNLAVTTSATTVTVASDTGADAILPAATGTKAGVMSAADKTKLDGLSGGATGGASPTDLTIANRTAATLDIASSTGTDATLPTATAALAGLMTAADKNKLDGLSSGGGSVSRVTRKLTVVANTKTVSAYVTGFGAQSELDAGTLAASVDGTGSMALTLANIGAVDIASVAINVPVGANNGTGFTFVAPDPTGASTLDDSSLASMVIYNEAGATVAATLVTLAMSGTNLSVSKTSLTAGSAYRFKISY